IEETGGVFLADESGAGKAHAKANAIGAFNPDGFVILTWPPKASADPVIQRKPLAGHGRAVHLHEAHARNPAPVIVQPAFLRPAMGDLHPLGGDFALLQVFLTLEL